MSVNEKGRGGLKDQLKKLFGFKPKEPTREKKPANVIRDAEQRQPAVQQSKTLKRNQNREQLTLKNRKKSSGAESSSAPQQPEKPAKKTQSKSKRRKKSARIRQLERELAFHQSLSVYGGGKQSTALQPEQKLRVPSLVPLGDPESIEASDIFLKGASELGDPILLHEPICWKHHSLNQRLANPKILRLGLDMGTSATKIVVHDPTRDGATWAVPFFNSGPNPYLAPTAIDWNGSRPFVSTLSDALRPFKWHLINGSVNVENLTDAAAYLALVFRHVVAWVHQNHGRYYTPESLIWEVRVGLPAKSAQDSRLQDTYRALLNLAVSIASQDGEIDKQDVQRAASDCIQDIRSGLEIPIDDHFDLSGMLLPLEATPEIAANIAGFYRSRKWDSRRPYGLLLDVGASTLDCAFCSFVDRNDNVALSEFTRSIEPLGVFRLHESRVEWLLSQLDAMEGVDAPIADRLLNQLTSLSFDQPIPDRIEDYVENAKIDGSWTDRDFRKLVEHTVGENNLIDGAKRFFGGKIPLNGVIPVYISGGGSRHDLYRSYLERVSKSANTTWSLKIEPLGIPDSVEAPGIPKSTRDRLAVAYGLCVDEEWLINYPDEIGDFTVHRKNGEVTFISKDMV